MLLKRLELQGFKSFADKTVLDLSHKVTAIVGPNGSGKSNITDSVRWLLGERDARNLRGGKGEDLIFAGTKNKPRAGQAWACLHFDNSSGFFPIDFKDVAISRKVARDGSSLFTINKSEVRLKDVVEFFAKSKTGARGLNIINQGESDIFIKATPQERRSMIEEILGLKEYQIKKEDAVRKLKNTSVNLDKARVLIGELEPHLRLLRRQVKRYEGREDAEKELRELEDSFYGRQLGELEESMKSLVGEEEETRALLKAEGLRLTGLQGDLEKIRRSEPQSAEDLRKIKLEEEKLYQRRAELQLELGKMEVRLELAGDDQEVNPGQARRVLAEVRKIAEKLIGEGSLERIRDGLKQIVGLVGLSGGKKTDGSAEHRKAHTELLAEISKLEKKLNDTKKRGEETSASLQGFNENFAKAYELVAKQQLKINELTSRENDCLVKRERCVARLESLQEELKQIGRSRESLRAGAQKTDSPDSEIRQKMLRIRSQLASIGEVDESVVKEAGETEERHAFLVSQIRDSEGAVADLRQLIGELERKIHGDFNDAIKKIDGEFNKLIQLVFGGGKAGLKLEKVGAVKSGTQSEEAAEGGDQAAEEESGILPPGVLIDIVLPMKRIRGLEVLSGGERALVSIAALFSLISVSAPPFLFLDEVDAALDERNAQRFGEILKGFSKRTQFVIVTHNRATMEAADVLYGVTMSQDGTSKLVSLKLT